MEKNKNSLPRPPPQPSTVPNTDFSQPIIKNHQKDQFANFNRKHEASVRNHSFQEHFGSLTETHNSNTEVIL